MRMKKRSSLPPSKSIALAAMFSSLGLLFLYAATIVPTGRIGLYAIAAFFVAGLANEGEVGLAWMQYIVVSTLGMLLVPDWTRVLPYVIFFGHYAIFKYYIESRFRSSLIGWLLKFLVFNGFMAIVMLVAQAVLFPKGMPLPLWAVIAIAQPAFLIYDIAFTGVIRLYEDNIRRWLFK
ncbi:MAG: hypothetical protein ACOYJD_06000 [Christensenellales bacterium]|jgi:hypothetical protein